jgi:hypothetical protein
MDTGKVEGLLPQGARVYREYEAVLSDDTRTSVAVTLAGTCEGSQARASEAVAYGHVLILDSPEGLPPLKWTFDGAQIHIVMEALAAGALRTELREAIGTFVLHFLQTLEQEIDALPDPSLLH